ncbi:hypothetical protein sr15653 [Sporisorium reilianum SRZ2]|uniref:Uncharacterized protein n=2 Tax=Sporisorium reilianum TaxID=72558 RepID=E6ZR77_SPORE|nr:hypothetical protein sr15653 [Sporisorium reilianum SRZ2]SJX65382.1 uncharacterized protein SRS1_15653 [Sporisorium reilianum f. sp. reilianum]
MRSLLTSRAGAAAGDRGTRHARNPAALGMLLVVLFVLFSGVVAASPVPRTPMEFEKRLSKRDGQQHALERRNAAVAPFPGVPLGEMKHWDTAPTVPHLGGVPKPQIAPQHSQQPPPSQPQFKPPQQQPPSEPLHPQQNAGQPAGAGAGSKPAGDWRLFLSAQF